MKEYIRPIAEKIEFEFKNQIVASDGTPSCTGTVTHSTDTNVSLGEPCISNTTVKPAFQLGG
ncbi:MAG: hypothetical protein HUJ76_09525 [Parasporobacterium sp.]|nr:hypothetical protein [Parasporobacterium sp.]